MLGWTIPFAILIVYALLLAMPATHPFAHAMTFEKGAVELSTFVLLIVAAWLSLRLASRARACGENRMTWSFFALAGAGLFVIGMEEIAWGQKFLGWSTPEAWSALNAQRETTLHNLRPLHGRDAELRVILALGGMLMIALGRFPAFRPIAAPAALLPWFLAIGLEGSAKHYVRFAGYDEEFTRNLWVMAEVSELMIAIVAVLYVMDRRKALQLRSAGAEQR